MSVLTFAHRDECWKKGENPFNPTAQQLIDEVTKDMYLAMVIKELKGGVKRGNRK
jgi:hypothetical protein